MQVEEWIALQRELQVTAFGKDPVTLEGDALGEYVTWNAWALVSELNELLQEMQWKPWAENRGTIINQERALGEIVDIMHFLANLILAFKVHPSEIEDAYRSKVEVNARRQEEGYDGMTGKCPQCKRDLAEAGTEVDDLVLFEGARIRVESCAACGAELSRENL